MRREGFAPITRASIARAFLKIVHQPRTIAASVGLQPRSGHCCKTAITRLILSVPLNKAGNGWWKRCLPQVEQVNRAPELCSRSPVCTRVC